MSPVSRGFGARRRETNDRLPPGQYLTTDFPVLSAGPTPRIDPTEWRFAIRDERGDSRSWTWDEFHALPFEDIHTDIHCVTRWSKLDTTWRASRSTRSWRASRRMPRRQIGRAHV